MKRTAIMVGAIIGLATLMTGCGESQSDVTAVNNSAPPSTSLVESATPLASAALGAVVDDPAAMTWLCSNSFTQDQWPQQANSNLPTWESLMRACSGNGFDREAAPSFSTSSAPQGGVSGDGSGQVGALGQQAPGPDLVFVPNVVGMDIDDAKRTIAAHQLRLNAVIGIHGVVRSQYPEAGTQVRMRSGVILRAED